ncbi:MAG: VWA domain-containing protein [Fimbriimonas sp.]
MRFTNPAYLLLVLPLIAGLVLSWRHVHGMAKGRKRIAFGIRFLLGSLVIFALAGPESRRPNEGLCTIFLVDRSDSISERDRKRSDEFVDKALRQLSPNDVAGVVVFGKNAVVEAAPGGRRSLGKVLSTVTGTASDLAAAVRLASASFPEGKARRVVVLSDGNETAGDLAGAAQVAATDGIPMDVVPLGLEPRKGEAALVAMEAPSEIRQDQPFQIRVIADATGEQSGTLDIDLDGVLVKRQSVSLTPGRNAILVDGKLDDVGFHRYRATLRTDRDIDNRNNVAMAFTAVRGKPRILVLQQDPSTTSLASGLRQSGITVDVGGPANIPTKPEELQRYDAIFLNDINASNFTMGQMKLIQSAVRDTGLGFAMIGGENSFLPGGWYGTPVAEALPVDLNIRQRKTFPSTSICILIDASGSMGMVEDGQQKIRLAAQAAEQTVKLMSPMDRVGVAGSSDGIEFVAPMQKLTNKSAVISQIRKLGLGGGGIYIGPTVKKAEEILQKENSKVRHFILLADGNDSTDEGDAVQRTFRMRMDKITTSVVAIGDGKDVPLLKRVAAAGGGRFYLAKRAAQLPAIFTQDTALMSRSAIEEGAFIPKLNFGEDILRGVAEDGVPPLLAYCLTDTRPLSKVGMRTHKDDPLLATWQYGLGTALAFTSDAQPRWAQRWVSWGGFPAFWAQAARAVSRRATLNKYQISTRNEAGKGIIEVDAFDRFNNPLTANDATVRVAAPDGSSREVNLSQTAPGKYQGSFEVNAIGTYIVAITEKGADGQMRTNPSAIVNPYPAEYRTYRANRPLLERSAAETGGKPISDPVEALRPVKDPGASIQELWPICLLLAALLLPIDVGVRRLALPMAEIFAKLWARLRRRPEPVTSTQQVVVGRLQQAKQRAQTTGEEPERVFVPSEPAARPQPRPVAPTAQGSTAKGLLEKKRQKKE